MSGRRALSDETYVLDLCDAILGKSSLRQHRFPFLLGDPGKSGRKVRLPVDSYYPELGLVIEYHERQHLEAVRHFDKPDRITVSGVHRGEQRRIYDERRREVLPENGLVLLRLDCRQFACSHAKRLLRVAEDKLVIQRALGEAGIIFAAENGEGPGVRLRKSL